MNPERTILFTENLKGPFKAAMVSVDGFQQDDVGMNVRKVRPSEMNQFAPFDYIWIRV